jgi:hypothetical protein
VDRLRKRDQLLSLKFSTIEACFSVPMLNLTLPNFPFVVAFAVKVLGWKAETIGLMAALPHICNCIQPVLLGALTKRLSTYQTLVLTFTLGALPWSMAWALPRLGPFVGHRRFPNWCPNGLEAVTLQSVTSSSAFGPCWR